ncbi:MAG: hypothetical protein IJU75_00020 [Clostridia bacterium]|nr:hypothetical protein [Clostridia bacterium]
MKKAIITSTALLLVLFVLSACGECRHTDVITDPAVAPTEYETGMTEGRRCAACGEVLSERVIIPATANFTLPSDEEIGKFESAALTVVLNAGNYENGNALDPKTAARTYFYAVLSNEPIYPSMQGWDIPDDDPVVDRIKKFDSDSVYFSPLKKSVPAEGIGKFFCADSIDFSGIGDYSLNERYFDAVAVFDGSSGAVVYYALPTGMGGGPEFDDIEEKPYELSHVKNGDSDYTFIVKKYYAEKPADMSGVGETPIYILTWESPFYVTNTFAFNENQYKRQLEDGTFESGGEYGRGSYTVTESTGYVRTWYVRALHVDGGFRVRSVSYLSGATPAP